MIQRFTKGPVGVVQKLNEIIDYVNAQPSIIGDGFVQVGHTLPGRTARLGIEQVLPRIPRRAALSTGLVGWWQFSNDSANDSSKKGNDGTFQGDAASPRDILELYGDGDYVDCGNDSSLFPDKWTVTAWVRCIGTGNQVLLAFGTIYPKILIKNVTAPRIWMNFLNYRTFDASAWTTISDKRWHHVAFTMPGSAGDDIESAQMYLDGQTVGTGLTNTSGFQLAKANVYIGARGGGADPFKSYIDEVRLYNRVLNDYEILRLYEQQNKRHGHFNEVFGAVRIFVVQSAAAGDGIYNCYEQTLDATEWDDTAGDLKFDDYDTTEIEVLNLAEFDPEATYVAHLAASDLLVASRIYDDENNPRWVGVPFKQGAHGSGLRRAFCKTASGAGTTLTCYLDTDGTGTEITVNFDIAQGGANLNAAVPRLADGDGISVYKCGASWYCATTFMPSEDCDCFEA